MLIYKQDQSSQNVERYVSYLIILISLLVGGAFGVVSTKGDILMISMAVSVLIGTFLMLRPDWIIWVVFTLGILVIGMVPLFLPSLDSKAGWGISILGFVLLLIAIYQVSTHQQARRHTPAFIWLFLVFFFYTVLVSLLRFYSIDQFATGFKRYFQMLGLLFALCWLKFDQKLFKRWLLLFLLMAAVQFPVALYELITWVPIRKAMQSASPGMIPMDVVAGTFGATYDGGGNSGEMAAYQVIVLGFLLSRKMLNVLPVAKLIGLMLLVMSPLAIAETKAVIVMLPIMILALYYRELVARPHIGVLIVLIGGLMMSLLLMAYMEITHQTLDEMIADTLQYNVGEAGYGEFSLNRTTVLSFWLEQQGWHDPVAMLFGNGLGSAHIAPKGAMGHMAARFPSYGIGLTAVAILLWETGVLGFGLFLSIFILAWRMAAKLYAASSEPWVKADAAAIQAAMAIFIFHMFYTMGLIEVVTFEIVFMAVLGYLAWLYRRHMQLLHKST